MIADSVSRRESDRSSEKTGGCYGGGTLSARLLHYRRPFGHVAFYALRHRLRCAATHFHAQLAYLLLDIGTRQDLVDGPGENIDDRLGASQRGRKSRSNSRLQSL